MTLHIAKRDGGKTSEQGFSRSSTKQFQRDGIYADGDFLVHESATPDNNVQIDTGDIVIGDDSPDTNQPDYFYHGWSTAQESRTISSNSSGSTRIDIVVAYVDLSVQDTTNSDNPGALKITVVEGTAGSGAPTESDIQTSVGSGNPWVNLAEVTAADGFSSITNSEIADMRPNADTSWRRHNDTVKDFVQSGYSVTQDSGLDGTISKGEAYIGGRKVDKPEIAHTFSTSVDTYIDLPDTAKPTNTDDFTYTEVSNGASAPSLASDSIRIGKVVTDGSGITSITQDGSDDGNGNPIYKDWPEDIESFVSGTDGDENRYIQYPDGTLVCWCKRLVLSTIESSGARIAGTWNFAKAFVDTNYTVKGNVVVAADTDSAGQSGKNASPSTTEIFNACEIGDITTSSCGVGLERISGGTNFASGDEMYVNMVAIGRWK